MNGQMIRNLALFAAILSTGFLTIEPAHAAPIPGTATSTLISPHLGLYRSPQGFQISAGDSGWTHEAAPANDKLITTLYRAPASTAIAKNGKKGETASLTVRVDKLDRDMPLEKYIRRWMKEYPKYGFDVLGSKTFAQNKQKGYVLDLVNRDNGRQLRQVVFLRKKRAVILTCRDQSASFKTTLKGCNEIFRTFAWVE